MRYFVIALALTLCVASLTLAAEERWRYSNNNYNATTSFGGSWHPGTVFKPSSGQYPVFLKTLHYGFGTANVSVEARVWATTGNTPGSLIASFPVTTKAWTAWTDVDVSSSNIVIASDNFFLSTNNPQMGPLGASFRGSGIPGNYQGYHYYSQDDKSWNSWTTTDWAIECTVNTNYSGIAPASLGRVKALYR